MQAAIESVQVTSRAPRRKVPQTLDAINHAGAHLRLEVVLALAGVSRSQFYRLIAEGSAPKPLRFGPRCSRWLSSDVTKFLADRTAKGAN